MNRNIQKKTNKSIYIYTYRVVMTDLAIASNGFIVGKLRDFVHMNGLMWI